MQKFKNLRTKSKLTIAFSAMTLVAMLIGAIGIIGMQLIKNADAHLYEENTLPTGYLAVLNDIVASERNACNQIAVFLQDDPTYAQEQIEYLAKKDAEFKEELAIYQQTITTAEEEAEYALLETQYNGAFAAAKEQVLAAAAAGDVAKLQQLVLVVDAEGGSVSDIIDESIEMNRLSAEKKVAENQSLALIATIVEIAALALGIALAAVCITAISNIIAKPLARIMKVTAQVGESGSMEFSEETVAQIKEDGAFKDEVGTTASSFAAMMDSLIAKTKVLEQVAGGDLTVRVQKASEQDTLGNAIESMLANLNDMFSQVSTATNQVNTGATQIADGATALSQGATEQASAVEELSATISEVLSETQANSKSAEEALVSMNRASDLMGTCTEYMGEMQTAMGGISSSSEEIAKVIKVIDDIAFQTNILALNAAVEAARAGQHGKGFAVVADEVRNLASKSAEAAKETATLIQTSVDHVAKGDAIAKKTSESIDAVAETARHTQEMIAEINTASQHQETAITQINTGIEQISQVVQTNSATAEESAASSEELSGQAQLLEKLVSRFKLSDTALPAHAAAQQPALPPSGGHSFGHTAPASVGQDIIF